MQGQHCERAKDKYWKGNLFFPRPPVTIFLIDEHQILCMCAYRCANFPQIMWKVACGHGVTKRDLILADRGTWFRFHPNSNPYTEMLCTSSPALKRLCLPLCEVETRLRWGWNEMTRWSSQQRDVCGCTASVLRGAVAAARLACLGRLWAQPSESVSTSPAHRPWEMAAFLSFQGYFWWSVCLWALLSVWMENQGYVTSISQFLKP